MSNTCSIEDCEGKHEVRGYCPKHYMRWKKYGDPLITAWERAENGSGYINSDGYKYISVNGKQVLEHRYVIEQKLGRPLKSHEVVHHKDGNKLNNNPNNLEVVNGIGKHNGMHAYYRIDWDSVTHRTCTKCGKKKKVKFFYRRKSGVRVGVYFSWCRRCCNRYSSNYRACVGGRK